jgi:hypothetical protein
VRISQETEYTKHVEKLLYLAQPEDLSLVPIHQFEGLLEALLFFSFW